MVNPFGRAAAIITGVLVFAAIILGAGMTVQLDAYDPYDDNLVRAAALGWWAQLCITIAVVTFAVALLIGAMDWIAKRIAPHAFVAPAAKSD